MRKSLYLVLLLLVASTALASPPPPHSEVWEYYFDCAGNSTGWRTTICSGTVYQSPTITGVYKVVEWNGCYEPDSGYQWYYWDGDSWEEFEGPPSWGC